MKQEKTYSSDSDMHKITEEESKPVKKQIAFSFFNRKTNNKAVSLLKQKLLAEFEPVIKRTLQAVEPVKNRIIANPIPTLMIMIIIILLNATLVIGFADNKQPGSYTYTAMIKKISQDLTNDSLASKPPSGPWLLFDAITDLQSIEQIRDSLDLLLLKKHLTAEDSLAFIRLSERL